MANELKQMKKYFIQSQFGMAVRGLAIIECSHVQKDKPGKETDLSEQMPLTGTQDNKGEFMAFE